MSNPTSNFGWQMPTATDLVTDLPADFEVFGQAVDTDFVDLLGGTTGQILSKTSATDLDFTWIANDQGDITGVTAGNGITVTSPTGPVPTVAIDTAVTVDKTTAQTLTNKTLTSPALTTPTISTATTNGDILYGTGSGALARLGIGSASQVLTVSGGIPAWTTPSSGAFTLISRSSFTTVSTTTTTFDAMFTTTYKAYRIVVENISSSSAPPIVFYWQWRKSGPSTHTANYYAGSSRVNFNGAQTLAGNNNASQYSLDDIGNTASNAYSFDVYRVGQGTSVQPLIYGMGTGYSGNIGPYTFGGTLDATINTTGFILSAASGTITGTVAVYGLATS